MKKPIVCKCGVELEKVSDHRLHRADMVLEAVLSGKAARPDELVKDIDAHDSFIVRV